MSEEKKEEENPWETGLKLAGIGVAVAAAAGGIAYLISKTSEESETSENRVQCSRRASENRPQQVRSLPYYTSATTSEPAHEKEMCVVCWATMKPLRRLNCGHVFHYDCVSTWLSEKPTCPLCRKQQYYTRM
ncbi:hypothetical protein ILUMI_27079 [Ignelater luminosus]|uniref:RING-type domain-containing protein n=1 Tax=Ignelater luminosus TaxID=2038154 RepID=A0A8K0FY23_IGNLU|nr:hypothetical protein ILUMI_27079 [Ignelater luminosus]